MEELDILDELENTQGTNAKKALMQKHCKNIPLMELIDATYNYKRKYHIKSFDVCNDSPQLFYKHQHFMDMLTTLQRAGSRSDASKALVETFFLSCTDQEAKWYKRVLLRDLRCNMSISTLNDAGFNIPTFEVQLAKDGKKCDKLKQIITAGAYISPKLDGYRCIAYVDNGEATLYSREGTEFVNFPIIKAAVEDLAKKANKPNIVFDGEIMSNDFNSMQQSAFASTRGTTVGDVVYNIFDMISKDEWDTDNFKEVAMLRYKKLEIMGTAHPTEHIAIVPHIQCCSLDAALQYEASYIAQGFEGAMVNPNIPYYRGKKSNRMLKLKTFLSQDCLVTGIYEGTGRLAGKLGGIHVIQENGMRCDVGSGFDDNEREAIWKDPSIILNRLVEIKFQEMTPDGVFRFPVFTRFRDKGNTGKI